MRLSITGIFLQITLSVYYLFPSLALAQEFSSLAAFGDNISDPGNIPGIIEQGNALGLGPEEPNFPPSPPYFGNRYSNGLVAAEQLPNLLGIAPESVSNFSVGNAFSAPLPVDLAGGILLGNGSSIPGPIGRGIEALNGFDIQSQVKLFLEDNPVLNENDLMLVYASANDGALALNTSALLQLDLASAVQVINAGAMANAVNTAASAQMLIDAGARHVVLAALPDIGRTPAAMAGGLSGVQGATLFSQVTNSSLAAEAVKLNENTPAVVYVFDSFTLSQDITDNPEKYGFLNADAPCLFIDECVSAATEFQNQLFFFDEFFPTEAGHRIAALALADTLFAPTTIASQVEVARVTSERFARKLLSVPSAEGESSAIIGVDIYDLDRSGELEAAAYDAGMVRVDFGASLALDERNALSFLVALDEGTVDTKNGLSRYDFFAVRLGAGLQHRSELLNLSAVAGVSFDDFAQIERDTLVANQTAVGETDGISVPLLVEAKKPIALEALTFSPLVRLGYTYSEVDAYTETGATALEQIVKKRDSDSLYTEVGAEAEGTWDTEHATFKLRTKGYYHTTLNNSDQSVETALVSVEDVVRRFSVEAPDESYFVVGGGLEVGCKVSGVSLGVDAESVLDSEIDGWGILVNAALPLN